MVIHFVMPVQDSVDETLLDRAFGWGMADSLFNGALACATLNRTLFGCGIAQWSYFLVAYTRISTTKSFLYIHYTGTAKFFRIA